MLERVGGDRSLGQELQLALYHEVHRIAPRLQTDYTGHITRKGDTVAFPEPNRRFIETRLCVDRVIRIRGHDMRELVQRAMVDIEPAVAFMSGAKRFALQVPTVISNHDPADQRGRLYFTEIVWGVA